MNCKVCNAPLTVRQNKFCSKKCQYIGFSGINNPSYKNAKQKSICIECGKKFEYYKGCSIGKYCSNKCCLKSNEWRLKNALAKTGKKRSEESKQKQSLSMQGVPKSEEFKLKMKKITTERYDKIGRTTPLLTQIRNSEMYSEWRKSVFERDKYTCVKCGDTIGGNLEADHEISLSFLVQEVAILGYGNIFDIDNGRTLCEKCHKKTKSYARHTKLCNEHKLLSVIKDGWEHSETGLDFDTWYDEEMEKIIAHFKTKLD